jgi:polysaccharide biosynthesis protein PslH
MKILQVCHKPPYPPKDGGSLAMYSLAKALKECGVDVTVLTMYTAKHPLAEPHYKEYCEIMPVQGVYVETRIGWWGFIKNLFFSDSPYTASRFISESFKQELQRTIRNGSFDIVQLEGSYLTPYIKAVREVTQARIALRSHNIEHEIWERMARQKKHGIKRKYYRLLAQRVRKFEHAAINRYDLLVPITARDLDEYNHMGNQRPALACPAGIDFSNIEPVKYQAVPFILYFLGSLDWLPNQEGIFWFLSAVYPLLLKQYPTLEFHVAGRNAPRSLIRKMQQPGIRFYGEVKDPQAFITAHPVLVAPCFSGSGMRVKIIEAMAMARTVITTSIGAEGIQAVPGKEIMIADNVEKFVACISQLIKHPQICEDMGSNARDFAYKNYNILNIASSLTNFYHINLK